jgi:hypothetical protein
LGYGGIILNYNKGETMQVPWLVILVAALALGVIMLSRPGYGISESIQIQGIAMYVSLDEIFKTFMKPGGISPIAILKGHRLVWDTSSTPLNPDSTYTNKEVYTVIIETPVLIDIDSVPIFQKQVEKKLFILFQRNRVFQHFTDSYGNAIDTKTLVVIRSGIIIAAAILAVIVILKASHGLRK